jgi:hypothetical protein
VPLRQLRFDGGQQEPEVVCLVLEVREVDFEFFF